MFASLRMGCGVAMPERPERPIEWHPGGEEARNEARPQLSMLRLHRVTPLARASVPQFALPPAVRAGVLRKLEMPAEV